MCANEGKKNQQMFEFDVVMKYLSFECTVTVSWSNSLTLCKVWRRTLSRMLNSLCEWKQVPVLFSQSWCGPVSNYIMKKSFKYIPFSASLDICISLTKLLHFSDFVCKLSLLSCLSLFHCRYSGDSVRLRHHSSWRDPRRDPGLQYGRPAAVWLRGHQEQSASEASFVIIIVAVLLLRGWCQVGVGRLRRWCGVWLWKVKAVYGCQEKERQEWHQDAHRPAQQRSWEAGKN